MRTHMNIYAHVHTHNSQYLLWENKNKCQKFLTFTRVSLPNSLSSHTLTTPSKIMLDSEGVNVYNENVFVQCKVAKKIKAHKLERNELFVLNIFRFIYTFINTLLCP